MNDLSFNEVSVRVLKPSISFNDYEDLIKEAHIVSDFIDSIVLTEENVKEAKKVLAKANKAIKELNNRRIAIKKEILEPYELFNEKIKDIERIVKEADTRLRNEVRKLEEDERLRKEEDIKSLWEKRVFQYEYARFMEFSDFLEGKHLNKTYTLSKVEDDMVDFLEKSERDLEILVKRDYKEEAIELYKDSKDLGVVLSILDEKERQRELLKEKLKAVESKKDEVFAFVVKGKKDKSFVEMLLRENEIEFELKELV